MASTDSPRKKLTETEVTFAFVIGGGLLLVMAGYGIAATQGSEAVNSTFLDLLMIVGATLAVTGTIAWLMVVRPWKNFDDWSVPLYTGHHHSAHEDDLTQIDGITDKTAKILNTVGIHTFTDLAKRSAADLERIVRDAGGRISSKPEAWISQAQMIAASGGDARTDDAHGSPAPAQH